MSNSSTIDTSRSRSSLPSLSLSQGSSVFQDDLGSYDFAGSIPVVKRNLGSIWGMEEEEKSMFRPLTAFGSLHNLKDNDPQNASITVEDQISHKEKKSRRPKKSSSPTSRGFSYVKENPTAPDTLLSQHAKKSSA